MSLRSALFKDDPKLQACLLHDAAHVTLGAVGDHVGKLQTALRLVDSLAIESHELFATKYGPSTAAAVLAFKKARHIINFSYQTQADGIVGKMTIAALDSEMLELERPIISAVQSIQQFIDAGRLAFLNPSEDVRSVGPALQPGLDSLQRSLGRFLGDVGLADISRADQGSAPVAHLLSAAAPFLTGADVADDADLSGFVEWQSLEEAALKAGILGLVVLAALDRHNTLERIKRKLQREAEREQAQVAAMTAAEARSKRQVVVATDAAFENCKQNNNKVAECLKQFVKDSALLLGDAYAKAAGAYKTQLFTWERVPLGQTNEFKRKLVELEREWKRLRQLLEDCLGCSGMRPV